MSRRTKLVVHWSRFLPYHHARLTAAKQLLAENAVEVNGLETSRLDTLYSAIQTADIDGDSTVTAFPDRDIDSINAGEMISGIHDLLDRLAPDAVAISGYGFTDALASLLWCLQTSTPAILMSESWEADFRRRRWREQLKSLIVQQFDAALVGGRKQRRYVEDLGIRPEMIFTGYDAVDNEYFARGAALARLNRAQSAQRFRLPPRFLLALGRFVDRKNFKRLLDAFGLFRQRSTACPWDLVIAGGGALESDLKEMARHPLLLGHVHFPGFFQYPDLPTLYGLADAFICPSETDQWALVVNEAMASGLPVLVSNQCGCAEDLVQTGVNGVVFDPLSVEEICTSIERLANCDLSQMGESSQAIIRNHAPEAFAAGLLSAYKAVRDRRAGRLRSTVGKSLVRLCLTGTIRSETFT